MSIAKGLKHLGFTSLVDFVLRDDNGTTVFEEWNSDQPQPTLEEIQAAWVEAQQVADADATAKDNRLASVKSKLESMGLTNEEVQDAFGI